MKTICIIPSRLNSTRLPRKPLLRFGGVPMIQMVYERARACTWLDEVIVATDSEEISTVIDNLGGKVIISDKDFITGTDRVADAAKYYPDADIVINLQGDAPFVTPDMLAQLTAPFFSFDNDVTMTTIASPLKTAKSYLDPNVVKVIIGSNGNAIYFSRAPIPYQRDAEIIKLPAYHHMGLYAFRRDFLLTFTSLAQTPLAQIESLEQLRALEHGFDIRVCLTCDNALDINTIDDYNLALKLIAEIENV